MALAFSKTYINIRHADGYRFRIVDITLDGAYVNGTGYTITPGNVDLTTKIVGFLPGNALGFMMRGTTSGNNANLRCYKTGAAVSTILAECATNEAGLNGLVIQALVVGA